jgi:hypothetical protein
MSTSGSVMLAKPADSKQPAFSVTASGSFDFDTDEQVVWCMIINFLGFTGGTAPTVTFVLNAIDEFGTLYPITLTPALAALSAAGQQIFHVGPGMPNQIAFKRYRMSWVTTGAPTTATAQISAYGKTFG